MIKLYEVTALNRNGKYDVIVYTNDMKTFYAERIRNNKIQKTYMIELDEEITKEELMEAQDLITKINGKYLPWKLLKMLIVIAIVHARKKHNTRNTAKIIKTITRSTGITPRMISHTMKELGI
ncbi:hypothetical protein AFV9_gp02 [Betalipothrixvirus uzonense]|uniref:Uncharacterized protein n=1 Tax=Betalipothrixvirus uzonense TaxID=512792 RepID=B2CRH9_9VIRU|nr:hypothetical protein AFV9_gp02 [Acidianus filamentous virus 9]ACB37236.1 hypothetical protein [Acidianus filamentous virus 9]